MEWKLLMSFGKEICIKLVHVFVFHLIILKVFFENFKVFGMLHEIWKMIEAIFQWDWAFQANLDNTIQFDPQFEPKVKPLISFVNPLYTTTIQARKTMNLPLFWDSGVD